LSRREPSAIAAIVSLQEAIMAHWRDTMVDRPEMDHPVEYAGGWVVSGLMVLATIFLVYHFGI
jgi:hypothetical protein